MTTIALNKTACAFLANAQSTDATRPRLCHILATDDGKLCATDGYRLHCVPGEADQIPGYYMWQKGTEMLLSIADANVDDGPKMYLAENLHRNNLMRSCIDTPIMPVVSGTFQTVTEWKAEYPKITKLGHSFAFRKGTVDGKHFAFCLGLNAMPFEFGGDGSVTLARRAGVIVVEAKYILDALWLGLVNPVMRWGQISPMLIGDVESAHALVMPFAHSEWQTPIDLQGLTPESKVFYAHYGNGNSKVTSR